MSITAASDTTRSDAIALGRAPVEISPVAWRPKHALPMEEWMRHGARFGVVNRACGWWIGDWINYGNAAYGEKYSRAARITRHDVQTLMNMAYVASRFEISRRRETVSWSHHAELASLPEEMQDRWLDRVELDALTVRDLRLELRRDRPGRHSTETGRIAATEHEPPLGDSGHDRFTCPRCGHVYPS